MLSESCLEPYIVLQGIIYNTAYLFSKCTIEKFLYCQGIAKMPAHLVIDDGRVRLGWGWQAVTVRRLVLTEVFISAPLWLAWTAIATTTGRRTG